MVVPVELRQRYLFRRIQDLDRLKLALENNDFLPALKLGHQVKGNAATFEFPHMAPIGQQLEFAARMQDKEALFTLILQMESAILNAQNIFV